jgi:hypothetical protein
MKYLSCRALWWHCERGWIMFSSCNLDWWTIVLLRRRRCNIHRFENNVDHAEGCIMTLTVCKSDPIPIVWNTHPTGNSADNSWSLKIRKNSKLTSANCCSKYTWLYSMTFFPWIVRSANTPIDTSFYLTNLLALLFDTVISSWDPAWWLVWSINLWWNRWVRRWDMKKTKVYAVFMCRWLKVDEISRATTRSSNDTNKLTLYTVRISR